MRRMPAAVPAITNVGVTAPGCGSLGTATGVELGPAATSTGVGVRVGIGVLVGRGVLVGLAVGVGVEDGCSVGEGSGVTLVVGVVVGAGERDGVGEPVGARETVGVGCTDAVGTGRVGVIHTNSTSPAMSGPHSLLVSPPGI